MTRKDQFIFIIAMMDRRRYSHLHRYYILIVCWVAITLTLFFSFIQSLYGVHGPNGVTQVFTLNGSLYSVGRDGYCRQYSFTPLKTEREKEEEESDGNEVIGLYESNRFHVRRLMYLYNICSCFYLFFSLSLYVVLTGLRE